MRKMVLLLLLSAGCFLSAQSNFPAKGDLATAQRVNLEFDGLERYYLIQPVHAPGLHPVVILLHGSTQTADGVWKQSSLPTLAARDGFIFVAPNGVGTHWNDGRGMALGGNPSTADDVGFLKEVIRQVVRNYSGDPDAVFMAGISNGGFMTFRFACEAGEQLHAAANTISTLPLDMTKSCKAPPMPWLSFNGTDDPLVSFNTTHAHKNSMGKRIPDLLSADDTFKFFAGRNQCGPINAGEKLPHLNADDPTWIEKRTCKDRQGIQSLQYVVHNGGHSLPDLQLKPLIRKVLGNSSQDIDGGEMLWNFFKQTLR